LSAVIDFSLITVPTAEPHAKKDPTKQLENACFVFLQIVQQLKSNGATLDLEQAASQTVNVDLDELTQAVQDLTFAGETLSLPGLDIKRAGKVVTIEYIP